MSDALRSPALEVGGVVAERYEILDVLGQGTTGTVFRARDLHVDTEREIVALKAIHPHLHSDRQIFGRVRREVEILRRLDGPYVCQLLDYIEDDGLVLIALEYVEGPSLDAYLRAHGPLPLSEILEIMRQICAALKTAHEAGVIHRDLKPSNVLIEGVGTKSDAEGAPLSFLAGLKVRVVDFGLAKIVAGEATGTALTEADMIFGTPDYMAPEQVAGDEVDLRCDLYAAGVMLYEMLVGKPPFERPGALATMTAHINEAAPPPRSAAPDRDIPPGLEHLVLKALAKRPDERFATAEALCEALDHIDEAPDTEPEVDSQGAPDDDANVSDTHLETAKTAIHTTMPSHLEETSPVQRGAKVRVVVREAVPSKPPSGPVTTPRRPSGLGAGAGERRLWTIAAVLLAIAAVAAGVFLGAR